MRIIHTADWHLGHRLGRIDRSAELRGAVGQVVDVCLRERADVLLVCGDLFHDVGRTDVLRESVAHLGEVLGPFFERGGTVLAITGNHDREHLAAILQQAMRLAAPGDSQLGGVLRPGRFHLFSGPTFFRMADSEASDGGGGFVQFVMMPWPTPTRYLDEPGQRFASVEERNRALRSAFSHRLQHVLRHEAFDPSLHTVLAAHVITSGAEVSSGLRGLNEADAVVVDDGALPTGLAYVALGDVHKPQCLMGLSHVRYAGSIARLDLGESGEEKGVVVVDVGPSEGRRGEPRCVPLEATPVYRVRVGDPPADLPTLAGRHPDRERALVNLHVTYRPGRDDLNDVLAELERIFPNWYDRHWEEAGGSDGAANGNGRAGATAADSAEPGRVAETVRAFLADRLAGDPDRDALIALADELLAEAE